MSDEYCPHCGGKVPLVRDAFCVTCGEALDEAPPTPRTPDEQKAFRVQLEQDAKQRLKLLGTGAIAQTFTAAFWGSASKPVQCESCGKSYVYQVKRLGQGEGTSPLFMDDEGAKNRATQRATRALHKALEGAMEVVPCPACDWIQSDMQTLARRQYLPRLKIMGIALLVALVIPLFVLLTAIAGAPDGPFPIRLVLELIVVLILQLTTGLTLLVVRSLASARYDPNAEDAAARLQKGRQRATLLEGLETRKQDGQ